MERRCEARRSLHLIASPFALVLAGASQAFANNAPGPLSVISVLSLVILIVALTFAGGGYAVLGRLDAARYPSKAKRTVRHVLEFIAGVVLFFAGIMTTIFGVLGFAIYAVVRGVKMIGWAGSAQRGGARPAHLEEVVPKRLRLAGIGLIVLTLIVLGYAVANIEDVTGTSDYRKRARVAVLNAEARNALTAAQQYLIENPGARMVSCGDLVKAGFVAQHPEITCSSDLTRTSGSIRMTGPASWKLTKPVAVITYGNMLIPAER